MIPQNYPLWINHENDDDLMLVIGWELQDSGSLRPVAIYVEVDAAAPFTVDGLYTVLGTKVPDEWPTP